MGFWKSAACAVAALGALAATPAAAATIMGSTPHSFAPGVYSVTYTFGAPVTGSISSWNEFNANVYDKNTGNYLYGYDYEYETNFKDFANATSVSIKLRIDNPGKYYDPHFPNEEERFYYEGWTTLYGMTDGPTTFDYDVRYITAVPEPETWALMIAGLGLAGAALRRRRLQTFA